MRRELAIEFSRVTEAAALAGYKWLGRGDKDRADAAAVEAMRVFLNGIAIKGEIVIGEGEIDEEHLGLPGGSRSASTSGSAPLPVAGVRAMKEEGIVNGQQYGRWEQDATGRRRWRRHQSR